MHPVLFTVFGHPITTFGVAMAVAFMVSAWIMQKAYEREGIEGDIAWQLLTWCMIGGVLGSKFWFVGEQLARGTNQSLTQLVVNFGGLTWYGGFVGGTMGGLIKSRLLKVPLLTTLNCGAAMLAVGQGIGRIGCFLVGDDYGHATDVAWAVAFPIGIDPIDVPVHPTQLYETFWLFAGGYLLWKRQGKSPFLFGEYLMVAGLGRLWIEIFRTNPPLAFGLTNAQWVAVASLLLGTIGWMIFRRQTLAKTTGGFPN